MIQPRLTILAERKDDPRLIQLYRLSMQVFVVAFFGLGGALAFFSEPILLLWTSRADVAADASPILFWYALANSVTGVLVLPFMLQFAKGQLRLQVISNVAMLLIFVPALVGAAVFWGAVGTGRMQFWGNLLFFSLWIPVVHKRLVPGISLSCMFADAWIPGGVMLLSLYVFARIFNDSLSDICTLLRIGVAFLIAVMLGIASGSLLRPFVIGLFRGAVK